MEIIGNTLDEIYTVLIHSLITTGEKVSPRGLEVKEIRGVLIKLNNPRYRLICNKERNINIRYAVGELLWYLSGSNKLDFIEFYNKRFPNFSDNGETLYGSYGKRIFDNSNGISPWEKLKEKLKEDPDSRQAVLTLYSTYDIFTNSKDIPCTISIQFMIRNSKLDCFVNMRSNDVIWGVPYDVFSFTSLQEILANDLKVDLGTYHHYVSSMHIYDYHYELANKIVSSKVESPICFPKFNNINKDSINKILTNERELREKGKLIKENSIELFHGMNNILNAQYYFRQNDRINFKIENEKYEYKIFNNK